VFSVVEEVLSFTWFAEGLFLFVELRTGKDLGTSLKDGFLLSERFRSKLHDLYGA
jgi:hypothetical protein